MNKRREWCLGAQITAVVIEALDEKDLILRFGGKFDEPESQIMRVANETRRLLQIGDTVEMRIEQLNPLRFRFIEPTEEQRRRGRLDVSI